MNRRYEHDTHKCIRTQAFSFLLYPRINIQGGLLGWKNNHINTQMKTLIFRSLIWLTWQRVLMNDTNVYLLQIQHAAGQYVTFDPSGHCAFLEGVWFQNAALGEGLKNWTIHIPTPTAEVHNQWRTTQVSSVGRWWHFQSVNFINGHRYSLNQPYTNLMEPFSNCSGLQKSVHR